jgi:hypothetical protein
VIDLASGDLDFPTPEHVVEAAHRAAQRGENRYTDLDGTLIRLDGLLMPGEWRSKWLTSKACVRLPRS